MKTGRNRHGRKDRSRRERAQRARALGGACAGSALATALALAGSDAARRAGGHRRRRLARRRARRRRGGGLVFSSPMRIGRRHLVRARPLRQQHRLRPDPAARHDRRRPPHPALRHHGQVRLPRPRLVTRVIDRGPYSPGNAFDLTNGARRALGFEGVGPGPLRGRAATPPRGYATKQDSAAEANLPWHGQVSNERSTGMSRSSHGAVDAGRPGGAVGWRWRSRWRGCLALLVALVGERRRGDQLADDRRARQTRRRCPIPPARSRPARRSAASPASRSAPARRAALPRPAATARSRPGR